MRLFRVEPKDEAASTFTLEEVATIVNQSRIEGVLDDSAGTVSAALEFTDKKAKDIAVPLTRARHPAASRSTPDEIERAVAKHGFSRYVIVDAEGRAARLRAPEGHPAGGRGTGCRDRRRAADAGQAHPPHGAGAGDDRPRGRARAHAPRRPSPGRVRDDEGDTTAVLFLEDIIEELIGEVQDATRRRA